MNNEDNTKLHIKIVPKKSRIEAGIYRRIFNS